MKLEIPADAEAVLADLASVFQAQAHDFASPEDPSEAELPNVEAKYRALLDTVGALVVVLDPEGRIMRFNRACETVTGYDFAEVEGRYVWDLFIRAEEAVELKTMLKYVSSTDAAKEYESQWITRDGSTRLISWSSTALPGPQGNPAYIIATGIDITERKHLEKKILEVSAREQRRIGQDLHDGLGQHL